MSGQLLIRIDPELKEKLARLARAEGKSASGVIREMISKYVTERDISAHVDALWARIGEKLKAKGGRASEVESAIRRVRRGRR